MGIDLHKETHTAVVLDCWRKSVSMYQKSDSYDAEAVALALINIWTVCRMRYQTINTGRWDAITRGIVRDLQHYQK